MVIIKNIEGQREVLTKVKKSVHKTIVREG